MRAPITRAVTAGIAAALMLLGACAGGEDVPVPTREELRAALLTESDLAGDWRTDFSEVVPADEPAPTPFTESCEEVTAEPAWQAATGLTAQDSAPGGVLQLFEFVHAADPDDVSSAFASLRDELTRCSERQLDELGVNAVTAEELTMPGVGDDLLATHFGGALVDDAGSGAVIDQYLALVRAGPVLAVVLTTERVPVEGWTGEMPEPSLTAGEFTTVVTTALDRLTGERPARTAPSASGDQVAGPVPWWNDTVFYEVFVRSFSDGDGDGNGDLSGLIAKLDYLNDGDPTTDDDLGVTGLWLMPVAQSPSYHGYDATDYTTVEEDYGTNADFQRLVAAAHERGIAVIVDLMLNHTSSEHPWFVESASNPDSARRDWYVWRDDDPGDTTSWGTPAWHELNDAFYLGLFWEGMPDLNFRNPAVTAQMEDVARFWIEDMGADGLRLDAVRHLIEDGGVFEGTPETHRWLMAWDDFVDGVDPAALTVGEVWDATAVVAPYVTDDEVDLAFEFDLAVSIVTSVRTSDATALDRALTAVLAAYPPGQFAPFLTNHDQDRVMSQLDGDGAAAGLAASVLLTLPGVPFVYYGEEIGMTGQKPDPQIRTPMQWSDAPNAGFSSGAPWEPPNEDYGDVNVADQDTDEGSLLNLYRRLVRLRNEHAALRTGGLQALGGTCPGTYAYLRTAPDAAPDDNLLVVLNLADRAQQGCAFSGEAGSLTAGRYDGTDLVTDTATGQLSVTEDGGIAPFVPVDALAPRQAAVISLSAGDRT